MNLDSDTAAAAAVTDRPAPRRRVPLSSLWEFIALTGILVAQPLFDLLRKNAGLFILWRLNGLQLVLFAAVVVLVPALAFYGIEAVVTLAVPKFRSVAHTALVAVLLLGIALVVAKKMTTLGPAGLWIVAIPAAVIGVVLLSRFEPLRVWLRYLAFAPVIFAVLFAGFSPVTRVAFGAEVPVSHVAVGNPSRVVMVVLDELPLESLLDGHGHVDGALFPNFAALERGANWYRNDTTVAPFTDAAVPAILTGKYPANERLLPYLSDYPQNLFTLLGGAYKMNVHETVTRLCPTSVCPEQQKLVTGTHPGFLGTIRDSYSIWRDFVSPKRTSSFSLDQQIAIDLRPFATGQTFVDSIEPTSQPRLDFLHVLIPHFPWHYLPTGQDYATIRGYTIGLDDQRWHDDWAGKLAYQRHLLQAQAADNLLGRVMRRLKAIGEYDGSTIVVTADHGASFEAGKPFRGVSQSTYPKILWTPLFIKLPHQAKGVVDDRPARSIDIVPTLADELGVSVPWKLDGRSLLGAPAPESPRRLLEWFRNEMKPPKGQHYMSFDGPAGFKQVLAARAAPPDPNGALRLYRVGAYGAMIGKPVSGFASTTTLPITVKLDDPLAYQYVDPRASSTPWAQIHATANIGGDGHVLALAVNGAIAGIYQTYGTKSRHRSEFWGLIPPTLLKRGHNTLAIFAVDGDPSAPVLHPGILS